MNINKKRKKIESADTKVPSVTLLMIIIMIKQKYAFTKPGEFTQHQIRTLCDESPFSKSTLDSPFYQTTLFQMRARKRLWPKSLQEGHGPREECQSRGWKTRFNDVGIRHPVSVGNLTARSFRLCRFELLLSRSVKTRRNGAWRKIQPLECYHCWS